MQPQKEGRENEEKIAEKYRKQGYIVLNVNEKGFPDLIVIKDKEIEMFVEVKGRKHPVHDFQKEMHRKLEKLGFKVVVEKIK